MRTACRLTQRRYREQAYSGRGSLKHNGRWHRAGLPVVYAAESPAVALLEVMVHVERPRLLAMELVVVPCHFDEELVRTPDELPDDWRAFPWPASTQQIGRAWFEEQKSAVFAVPSAVLPSARNYLLNPEHPQFGEIVIDAPEPLDLDPRLGRS